MTFLGCPVDESAVRLVDADVSTVTAEADKVIRVEWPSPWILHLELQASWDRQLDLRLNRYNGLLKYRHGLPVASVVVLLRQDANASALTGVLTNETPVGPRWEFRYEVLRVWERPATDCLNGPLGLVPLAPMANVRPLGVEHFVDQMCTRLKKHVDRPLARKLTAASYVLMGLRYEQSLIDNLLSGVMDMEESVTYQAIVKKGLQQGIQQGIQQGAVAEARKFLLLAGKPKFGFPSQSVSTTIEEIADLSKLESLASRIYTSSSWDELLKAD